MNTVVKRDPLALSAGDAVKLVIPPHDFVVLEVATKP